MFAWQACTSIGKGHTQKNNNNNNDTTKHTQHYKRRERSLKRSCSACHWNTFTQIYTSSNSYSRLACQVSQRNRKRKSLLAEWIDGIHSVQFICVCHKNQNILLNVPVSEREWTERETVEKCPMFNCCWKVYSEDSTFIYFFVSESIWIDNRNGKQ